MTNEPKAPDEAPQPQQPDELATLRERVQTLEQDALVLMTGREDLRHVADTLRAELESIRKEAETNQKWAFLEWRDKAERSEAENARLREALDSIEVYGSDTLSGRVTPDAATYKNWLIDGIRVMRDRARAALAQTEAENG